MNMQTAINRAIKSAREANEERHIFFESGEYSIGSDFDADTFFLGTPVIATAYPDGEVYYSDRF